MTSPVPRRVLYPAAIVWLVLTASLAVWWMIFGLLQARQLAALPGADGLQLERVQRMLLWEGMTLIGLILVGGMGFVIGIRREQTRMVAVKAFFMAFTHDLKTALASFQLQAESLSEDLPEAASNPNMGRLLKDARRLTVQLENSLYFAQSEGELLIQPVQLAPRIERVAEDWPELAVTVDGNAQALVDTRALDTVLRNVFQNAVVHGGATGVCAAIDNAGASLVRITLRDNGRGVPPDVRDIMADTVTRSGPSAGSGMGLFISRQLARRMRGDLLVELRPEPGFSVILSLPAA